MFFYRKECIMQPVIVMHEHIYACGDMQGKILLCMNNIKFFSLTLINLVSETRFRKHVYIYNMYIYTKYVHIYIYWNLLTVDILHVLMYNCNFLTLHDWYYFFSCLYERKPKNVYRLIVATLIENFLLIHSWNKIFQRRTTLFSQVM